MDEWIEENLPCGMENEGGVCQWEDEARLQEQKFQEQEAERLRLEEQMQREREEARERVRREREEAAERKRRELEEDVERSQRAQEEAAQAAAARRAEAEHMAREQERKALVVAFLKEHGYSDVGAPKRTMLKTKYPIHTAVKTGDPKIVMALLEEGANPAQKNSAGKTAAQVAQQKNRKGSHANVLRALGGA